MGFAAWGDESGSHAREDPGVYLLGAAIAEDGVVDDLRLAMRHLRLPSSEPKLHWRAESGARPLEMVKTIASLPVEGFIVVRQASVRDRLERRRRKCLEQLLHEVADLGCEELTLESRGAADDRRDRQLLDRLRRNGRLGTGLVMSHAAGPADSVLWIADALCGAVTQERIGEPQYLKEIESRVTLRVI